MNTNGVTTHHRPVAVIAAAGLLAACGSAGAEPSAGSVPAPASTGEIAGPTDGRATPTEAITLTFESYTYGTESGGPGTEMLIDEFEASHPNITIEPVGTPSGDIHVSVAAKAAAGDPPDVAQIGWSKFAFVLEDLPYVPVEDIAGDDWDDHVAGMYPGVVSIGEHDGAVVGLPSTLSIPTMFYNADLFAAAGLDPDDPPATWSAAQQAGLTIREATDAEGIYVAVVDAAKSDYLTQSLLYSNGSELVDDAGALGFATDAGVGALATMQDLTSSGAQPAMTVGDAVALFQAGDLAMMVVSSAVLDLFVESADGQFDLRAAAMPGFDDQPPHPTTSGAGLFVFADEPARQQAAWEFVEFLTSDRGYEIVATEIGYLPLRPSLVTDSGPLDSYLDDNPLLRATIDQLDSVHPYQDLPGPDASRMREILQDDIVEPIVLGGADPAKTVDAGVEKMAELLP